MINLVEFAEMGRNPRPGVAEPSTEQAPHDEADLEVDGPIDPNYRYFGDAVRAARKKRGMTMFQLAAKAGVGLGSVHIIEHARQNPTFKILVTVADALDMKIGDLLPRSDVPYDSGRQEEIVSQLEAEADNMRKTLKRVDGLTKLLRGAEKK